MSTHTLYGVGVGPGDPELVTQKAVRVFEQADLVLVPSTEASGDDAGRAEQIVLAACPSTQPKLQRVPFSMAQRRGVGSKRRKAWEASAQAAVEAFRAGAGTVAFATVGDPSVYSTFSYLAAHVQGLVPDVEVVVVPGITAAQALAAASLIPLVEGQESMTLVPVTAGLEAVSAALDVADTVVAYKGGRQMPALLDLLRSRGRSGVMGVNIGLPGETITALAEVNAESVPYFSTVFVAPIRHETGGRL
ncbi:MAG: precorrin-2 C(20)-methyltransferase [Arachnia sp.]